MTWRLLTRLILSATLSFTDWFIGLISFKIRCTSSALAQPRDGGSCELHLACCIRVCKLASDHLLFIVNKFWTNFKWVTWCRGSWYCLWKFYALSAPFRFSAVSELSCCHQLYQSAAIRYISHMQAIWFSWRGWTKTLNSEIRQWLCCKFCDSLVNWCWGRGLAQFDPFFWYC